MSKTKIELKGSMKCGDWVYPTFNSNSSARYNIEYPLVAGFFLQEKFNDRVITDEPYIDCHLNDPRYILFTITHDMLYITNLKNSYEKDFNKNLCWKCSYELLRLDRLGDINLQQIIKVNKKEATPKEEVEVDNEVFYREINKILESPGKTAILITSILLQRYEEKGNSGLPKGISFRKARIPEIENIGRWH